MKVLYLMPGLICLLLGGIFLFITHHGRLEQETQDRNMTARAWAKLSDAESRVERDLDHKSYTRYFGIYEFDIPDGRHISVASNFGYYDPKVIPGAGGDPVEILYNPKNPNEFAIPEEQTISRSVLPKLKSTGVTLTVIGAILTVAAIAAMLGAFDSLLSFFTDQGGTQ